jgi:hypothetical protein
VSGKNEGTGRRRVLEIAFWPLIIAFFWTLDGWNKLAERERTGVGLNDFRLVAEQTTSAAAALCMVAFVAWWTRRFPLNSRRWGRTVAAYFAGSVLFAAGHYLLIVLFRIVVFHFSGRRYGVAESHLGNLVFEYQKDIKIYLSMVAIMVAYRYWRDYGRGRLEPRPRRPEMTEPGDPNPRLVVQTGSGERILKADQIDYLQAARNYVSIHAEGQEYILRETLGGLHARLRPADFVRTHRSYLVNMEKVREIRPAESGAWRVLLSSGADIPLSRTYRDSFRTLISN